MSLLSVWCHYKPHSDVAQPWNVSPFPQNSCQHSASNPTQWHGVISGQKPRSDATVSCNSPGISQSSVLFAREIWEILEMCTTLWCHFQVLDTNDVMIKLPTLLRRRQGSPTSRPCPSHQQPTGQLEDFPGERPHCWHSTAKWCHHSREPLPRLRWCNDVTFCVMLAIKPRLLLLQVSPPHAPLIAISNQAAPCDDVMWHHLHQSLPPGSLWLPVTG